MSEALTSPRLGADAATTTLAKVPGDGRTAQQLRRTHRQLSQLGQTLWPATDLILRIWLATIFVGYLSGYWTMVMWMPAEAAGLVTSAVLLVAAVLLAAILVKRPAR